MKTIHIMDKLDQIKYRQLSASLRDVKKELGCSNRTAFRLMNRYAVAVIVDHVDKKRYRVMTSWELESIKKWYFKERRGNPRFKDPLYQSQLARRPRHRGS